MGIFDKIKNAIFGDEQSPASTPVESASTPIPRPSEPVVASAAPSATPDTASWTAPVPESKPVTTAQAEPSASVDVGAILDKAVAKSGQKLDWRHSIVDLMKALGMDASLAERKELAEELDYTGDSQDSAKMNTFLHKALLQKLAENGGKIPAELTA